MNALSAGTRISMALLCLALLAVSCSAPRQEPPRPAPAAPVWQVIGPGGGGSMFIPTFNPADPDNILIRCDMSGAYLSSDGGQSWKMYNFPGGAQAFAFDPSDPQAIYVGAAGVHGSADGGKTWRLLFPHPDSVVEVCNVDDHADTYYLSRDNFPQGPGTYVSALLVDPADSKHFFAAVNCSNQENRVFGVFATRDGGRTWTLAAALENPVTRLFAPPGREGLLVVFTAASCCTLNKATHEIETAEKSLPQQVAPLECVDGGTDPVSGKFRFWAVAAGDRRRQKPGGVFISEDAAATWSEVTSVLENEAGEKTRRSFNYIATAAKDSRTAYLVCRASMEKNERGETGLWYGIFKTEDSGKSWRWVYRAGGGSQDYTVRDGWMADNLRDSWVREAFGGEFISVINTGVFPGDPQIAIFTDWYRSMKTVDGGATWEALYSENLPDGSVRSRGLDVTTTYGVHFDPFDSNHLVISYTDIAYFHSFNRGESWYRSVEGVPPAWDNTCYWVQFDPEIEGKLWSVWSAMHDIPKLKMIRTPGWQEWAVGGVCVSTDAGRTWEVSSQGLPENSPTTCIVMDPRSPAGGRTLYIAVYGKGVFKSTDDGKSWEEKNNGLGENLNAWELVVAGDGTLYLVITHNTRVEDGRVQPELMNGEIYRSTDGAGTWEKVGLPAGTRFPNSLAVDQQDPQRLYVACWASMNKGDYMARGGPQGIVASDGGVLVSGDGGASWKSVFDKKAYVYAVTPDNRHPGRVYLNTFHNAAFRSDDYGESWKKIRGYDFRWGHRVVIDNNDPEMVYVTSFGGSVFHGPPVAGE
ncbi:MAG: hypothetical protein JXQ83_13095 [Candidatus Glassbacteria bacterium]|nr:hypothetical protein [Candidatus Glassbacteria bacterium]